MKAFRNMQGRGVLLRDIPFTGTSELFVSSYY